MSACKKGPAKPLAAFVVGELDLEVEARGDSVLVVVRREGRGGVVLRATYLAGEFDCTALEPEFGETARLSVTSACGHHTIVLHAGASALESVRITVRSTPSAPTMIPFVPRDLYPMDERAIRSARSDMWRRNSAG